MIGKSLTKYREFGILLMRLGIGGTFVAHGLMKLMAGSTRWKGVGASMGDLGINLGPPVMWGLMASATEFLCGLLVVIGFLFRPALLGLIITMVVAVSWLITKGNDFSKWSYPLSMIIVFVGLMFIGPGRHSVDKD